MPRTTLSTRRSSIYVSLILQYSLIVSIVGLPGFRVANSQVQEKAAPAGKQSEAPPERGDLEPGGLRLTTVADSTAVLPLNGGEENGLIDGSKESFVAGWEKKAGLGGLSGVAEMLKGFDSSKFSTIGSTLLNTGSPSEPRSPAEQDPGRPMPPPPPPGIGSGGTGPDGSFNVEPPARRQGSPEGVRSVTGVLTDTRTARIPDAIPSTQPYCWPGDPECRKVKPTAGKPIPKPTPPPRSVGANRTAAARPSLVAANQEGYIEKLRRGLAPYYQLSRFGDLLRVGTIGTGDLPNRISPGGMFETKPGNTFTTGRTNSVYLWADCSNVEGYAYGAQISVYIYVDGLNVGNAPVDWNDYFTFDISSYVNDGAYHDVSAWYYDWSWNWVEAGSTGVPGVFLITISIIRGSNRPTRPAIRA